MSDKSSLLRNRNSWGPISVSTPICYRGKTNDEEAEEEDDEVKSIQARQLDPLKEDLADWLNKTLGVDYITKDNFLAELDNGVVLCHLAQGICDTIKQTVANGLIKGQIPSIRGKCFEKAARRSFFSRDNMENFIRFCRSLGVHENLLFESDDLVLHHQPRNVILCLLEVARIASKYGVEPPGLVQLEKQIAEEEGRSPGSRLSSLLSWQYPDSSFNSSSTFNSPSSFNSSSSFTKMRQSASASAISSVIDRWDGGHHVILVPERTSDLPSPIVAASGASDGVPSDNTEDEDWSRGSGEDPDRDLTPPPRPSSTGGGESPSPTTELDRKVQLAARLMQKNCNCSSGKCDKLKIRKVGEGKYNIAGKNVFVRLLKGRHMMVRVGGGWDTLDHFLLRHDPCQVKVMNRVTPERPSSASKYLHIRAKYRSPPPTR
ncbi:growth arrest-specific protein 2 isoform X2 [Leptinotarsa decemlineata]